MINITSVCDALIIPALCDTTVDSATVVEAVKNLQQLTSFEKMEADFKDWYAKHLDLDPKAARVGYLAGRSLLVA